MSCFSSMSMLGGPTLAALPPGNGFVDDARARRTPRRCSIRRRGGCSGRCAGRAAASRGRRPGGRRPRPGRGARRRRAGASASIADRRAAEARRGHRHARSPASCRRSAAPRSARRLRCPAPARRRSPLPVGPIAICGALACVGGRIEAPGLRLTAPRLDQRSPSKCATRTCSTTSPGRSSGTFVTSGLRPPGRRRRPARSSSPRGRGSCRSLLRCSGRSIAAGPKLRAPGPSTDAEQLVDGLAVLGRERRGPHDDRARRRWPRRCAASSPRTALRCRPASAPASGRPT